MEEQNKIALFEGIKIRKVLHNEVWYFSVVDIIQVLTDSKDPKNYWSKLKERDPQTLTVCQSFKLLAADGKMRKADCANTEGVLRIAMSVPSPKAEPLKLWLAEAGREKIEETENPELGFERLRELYLAKGHTEEWIKNRLQTINTRKQLTDEWQKRGIKEGQEYSILTATIAKGTFGVTPSEHKEIKGLTKPNQNLRDHMTPLELIFTALGEELTRMGSERENAQGFLENHDAAIDGGRVAGLARERVEKEKNISIVSPDNFLHLKTGENEDKPLGIEK
jgi:DNA-damage-inducible protein D